MRSGRLGIVALLVLSLAASAVTGRWADTLRRGAAYNPATGSGAGPSLANMNSYALGLLLGGLRGPLVMVLWSSSETQKAEKNLEDFDTKVEWIRLLQGDFDTVIIFQIWNKAYNISVMKANVANKYATILDALDFARSVDRERPDNINILQSIGQMIFFDKFGNAVEKNYYRKHVRDDSKWRTVTPQRQAGARTRLDPMLDANGYLLPDMIQPKPGRHRPADLAPGADWNDGSELQYLKAYEPFPHGVSPFALAYNYFKRAQVLQATANQRHIQLPPLVIDSRPATGLQNWAGEEQERARRAEARAFGKEAPAERFPLETTAADVPLDAEAQDQPARTEAIYSYNMAARLAQDALAEYERHLSNPDYRVANLDTSRSHMDDLSALVHLAAADRDYLKAMPASGQERQSLLDSARFHYQQAAERYRRTLLRYYVDEAVLAQVNVRRARVPQLSPEQLAEAYDGAMQLLSRPLAPDVETHSDEVLEYSSYVKRIVQRLALIGK